MGYGANVFKRFKRLEKGGLKEPGEMKRLNHSSSFSHDLVWLHLTLRVPIYHEPRRAPGTALTSRIKNHAFYFPCPDALTSGGLADSGGAAPLRIS